MAPSTQRDLSGYQYSALSSLVLSSGRAPRDNEPTGEAESLVGRIDPREMGSRAGRQPASRSTDAPKRKAADQVRTHVPRKRTAYSNVLEASADMEGLRYRPRTEETAAVYELLLSATHSALGDQASDVVRSAADTVLEILKDDEMRVLDKKREVEGVFGPISEETFTQFVNLAKRITDYTDEAPREEDAPAEDSGVAVLFEDEDEGPALDEDEEEDEEEQDEQDEGEENIDTQVASDERPSDFIVGKASADDVARVVPHEVDAFWLQRQLAVVYPDELEAAEKAAAALDILAADTDLRECENALMELFDYNHFELVQLLSTNRDVVVWGTRLARADGDARAQVEADMHAAGASHLLPAINPEAPAKGGASDAQEAVKVPAPLPRGGIDLADMAFAEGGHLNTNARVRLPAGSFKSTKQGYEEVHIPAPEKRAVAPGELVPIRTLPEWTHAAFSGATSLNPVQSTCFPVAFGSDEPMLLCAPTGAGKTNVAMLTILRELSKWRSDDGAIDTTAFKIVYVAPMKALVAEQAAAFRRRLEPYNVVVNELTGDSQLTKAQIAETQVIVTTPEKWDVISRKGSDASYTNLVRLLIIDEIHLLHDDRGPVLEAIVARTLRRSEALSDPVRVVGLSATLPNYQDVAAFLRVNLDSGLFYFDGSWRPCPLRQEFVGITENKALKRMQLMNDVVYEKALEHAGRNQMLVFVHSRKETAKTAAHIRDRAMEHDTLTQFLPGGSSHAVLQSEAEGALDSRLKDLLPYGFAVHHAGLPRADRQLVEDLFAAGHIQVLVSTATLAWGVNLPAHTVIIKGTQVYAPDKGRWTELSPQDMLQMLGRAGRPQYDTMGEGIVITQHTQLPYYLSLLNQQLPIESQFISRLADNLNAEIVLGTVRTRDEAVAWLGYTYLYVRMLRSPALYGVAADVAAADALLEQTRADMVHSAAELLEQAGLLRYERRTGLFASNELARIASHFYLGHSSMTTFHRHLRSHVSLIELLRVFSLADEFKHQTVRQDEKLELARLAERVPVPIKESPDEPSAKVNVLLQAYISQLALEGYALAADMVYVTQSASRILRALVEICLARGFGRAARVALELAKCTERRAWGAMTPLRQFPGVPADLVRRLERKEFPWSRMRDLEPNEIGELIGIPKAGRLVHRLVHQFPRLELQAFFQPITRSLLHVHLSITPDFEWDERVHGGALGFHVLVEDVDGELLLFRDYFVLLRRYASDEHTLTFTVPLTEPIPPNYYVTLLSDRWLQSEARLPISFKNLVLPERFPPPTPLLSLQPQVPAALRSPQAEAVFVGRFSTFNRVQTQSFHALYDTDDSVLVAAPTGAGKTVCAELALLRLWRSPDTGRAVCILPYAGMVAPRVEAWRKTFGEYAGCREVVALTDDTSANLRLLELADVVVATPEQWDVLSRRWRQRRNVQDVSLYIFDDVHMITDVRIGAAYETVCARSRFITAQTEKQTRIVALGVPMADAGDIGDWLGVPPAHVFNFAPSARPVPMEVHIQPFSVPHFPSFMLAMARPAYIAMAEYAPRSPILTFVPSRKQVRLTADDIITHALADGQGQSRFLHMELADLEPHLARVQDPSLAECLTHGVALYHMGLSRGDRRIVERLYEAGAVQVCIASRDTAWTLPLNAHLVLILSLQTYEGREHRYVDYPLTDMLQMVGHCTVPGDEGSSRCMLFVQSNRKDYYKKFLAEGLPVESKLHLYTHDYLNAEVVARTVEDKQAAVDMLTWTLLYRRLQKNPQAYGAQGRSMQHISDYLSELVETTLGELAESKCIAIEDEMDVIPLNLGMIASFYNVSYATVDMFNMSLSEKTRLRGMLEIVSASAEFEDIPIRQHEDVVLRRIYDRVPLKLDRINYESPYHKVFVLLQAHFARLQLPADLAQDQRDVLSRVLTLLAACVDVMSSGAFLNAIVAMELSHMCVQAVWDTDSPLRQVPHFTPEHIARCKLRGIGDVYELSDALPDMSDAERNDFLRMTPRQVADVARFTNAFPYIDVSFEVLDANELDSASPIMLTATLSRDMDDDEDADPTAVAPFFPSAKLVGWWLIVGDPGTRSLLGIKRVTISRTLDVRLEFSLPPGIHSRLKLYLMCDSYVGADRELDIPTLNVAEGEESDEDE